jgi:Phospholipase_D-nuclease N-terminal
MHLEAATNYPLLNAFWTMLFFFAWVVWFFLFVYIAWDIFRSRDLKGLAKVLWLILIIIVPFIGAAVYLIVRGNGMRSRAVVGTGGRPRGWW